MKVLKGWTFSKEAYIIDFIEISLSLETAFDC